MYFASIKASALIVTLWFIHDTVPVVTALKNWKRPLNHWYTPVLESVAKLKSNDDRSLQLSNNTETCNALIETAEECLLSNSGPECIDCLNNMINENNANLGNTTCISFETQICSAIVTCGCTACLEDLELAYSCDDSCDPVDCSSQTIAPSPSGTHECYPLFALENQCRQNTSVSCYECFDSAYNQMFADSEYVDCRIFEEQLCVAIFTCECEACQKEIERAYSCGNEFCPLRCMNSTLPPKPSERAECSTLFESAYQCFLTSNPHCSGCVESAYEQVLANSATVDCAFYENNFCSAIITCDCLACQKEIELAYSCGQLNCEPYDCSMFPSNMTNNTPGTDTSLPPVNETSRESENEAAAISPGVIVGPVAAICLIIFIAFLIRRRQLCGRRELKFFPSKRAREKEPDYEQPRLLCPKRPTNSSSLENQNILAYNPSNSGLNENAPEIVCGRREHYDVNPYPAPAFVSNVELYQPVFKDQTRTVNPFPIPLAVEVSSDPEAIPHRRRLDP